MYGSSKCSMKLHSLIFSIAYIGLDIAEVKIEQRLVNPLTFVVPAQSLAYLWHAQSVSAFAC